jgi:hypothetical protein
VRLPSDGDRRKVGAVLRPGLSNILSKTTRKGASGHEPAAGAAEKPLLVSKSVD